MTELFDHPYAGFLSQVLKPTRYLGAEAGAIKKDWAQVKGRVCLAFPDIYDIGMSHLGYRILYGLLNADPELLAERCYMPWVDFLQELEARGLPLASLESTRPLRDFDVVGFSLQFELTYTNILLMMERGGITLRSSERGEDEPLILAGGPVATHAEPMALFLDAILVGDGEEATGEIVHLWLRGKAEGKSRSERLRDLAKLTGVYVPSLYQREFCEDSGLWVVQAPARDEQAPPFPVERRLVPDLKAFPFPDSFPVGGPEAIFDRMSIEVARGCTEGCRFCQAGMIYRPVRERDPQEVVDTVLSALAKSGQDEVSLTALSTADVSCISPLIKTLVEKTAPERVSLSVASLRAYGLSHEILEEMKKVRAAGLTFAPEAGTQRMRDVINKNVTEEQLLETAERVFSLGYDRMKLYFILGLPTEEDVDVLGIADVGRNAWGVARRLGKRAQVTVSVSVHVPKPHTPFQWAQMDDISEVRRKQQLLKDALRRDKSITLRLHDSKTSELEGILARGDYRLGEVIERAYRSGARFDSWSEFYKAEAWNEALDHFNIDRSAILGALPLTARLPWDHLDVGLEEGFLAREYKKALASRLSPPCGKAKGQFVHHTNVQSADADTRKLVCYDCGIACDLSRMRGRRRDFLDKMGAHEAVRLPLLPVEEVLRRPDLPEPEKLRPVQNGGDKTRYRVRFSKTGPMALLGHLDLLRELPRVFRRAGLRPAYSEGFHPKPLLSFGPALALGVLSLGEYLDVTLLGAPALPELLARLSEAASPGLQFLDLCEITNADLGLSQLIDEAEYLLVWSKLGFPGGGTERLEEFLASEEFKVRREVKGISRMVDVRAGVLGLCWGGEAELQEVRAAGIVGEVVTARARLKVEASGSVRPSELGGALFPELRCLLIRTELRGQGQPPFDLAAHKKPIKPPSRSKEASVSAEEEPTEEASAYDPVELH